MENAVTTDTVHTDTHGAIRENNKKRLEYIDIARGIAIIFMIVGHVCKVGWKRTIIFSFHMPLFIIISGMFFKKGENIKDELIKLFKKLMIPYIITIIATELIRICIYNQTIDIGKVFQQIIFSYSNKKTFFIDVSGVGVLWFIPFLTLCKILFYAISKLAKEDDILKGIICLLFTMLGIYFSKIKLYLPWSFDIALASLIFYDIGYMLKKYNLLEKILSNYKILICIILMYFIGLKFGFIELAIRSYPHGLICYITAISGTIIVFKTSKMIEEISKYLSKLLCWFGKNSMYVLCFHYLEMNVIKYSYFGITSKWQLAVAKLIIITIFTFILTKIIKIIRDKKHKFV